MKSNKHTLPTTAESWDDMKQLLIWIQASRLPSQSYIFFPLLLGQSMAFYYKQTFDPFLFFLIHLFGLFIQLYIVYANDYADFEGDRENDTFNIFSGGSRVLVEGLLSKKSLKNGILTVIAGNIFLGLLFTLVYQRIFSLLFIAFSLFLLWAYSYPPFKLSYRGGGELLQALGVSVVLPLFSYYIQGNTLSAFPWFILVILFPIHLSCAISTALPDEPSDQRHQKRTMTIMRGAQTVKKWIYLLNGLSFFLLLLFPVVSLFWSLGILVLGTAFLLSMALYHNRSQPGTHGLLRFVSLNVITVLVFVGALSAYFYFTA